jgi:hypothetical protein
MSLRSRTVDLCQSSSEAFGTLAVVFMQNIAHGLRRHILLTQTLSLADVSPRLLTLVPVSNSCWVHIHMGLGRAWSVGFEEYWRLRHAPAGGGGNWLEAEQDRRVRVLRERIHIRGRPAGVSSSDVASGKIRSSIRYCATLLVLNAALMSNNFDVRRIMVWNLSRVDSFFAEHIPW